MHSDNRANAATRCEFGSQCRLPRLDHGDKVVQNSVGHIFVENAFIAKLLQVELEAFEFDALLIGGVIECQHAKIGLSRFGANGGEFGTNDFDLIVSFRKLIVKRFQNVAKVIRHERLFQRDEMG